MPPGRYTFQVFPALLLSMSEPTVGGPPFALAPGQVADCDPQVFADLGQVGLLLQADRPVEAVDFWISESRAEPLPTSLQEREVRASAKRHELRFGTQAELRFSFARVPWREVDVCAALRSWQGEETFADDQTVVKCERARRERLGDDASIELSFRR